MATGREGRAERLNERLRGAQRANVEDETFNLNIPDLEETASAAQPSSPLASRTPNSSAKRRRLNNGTGASVTSTRRSQRASAQTQAQPDTERDPFDLPATSKESDGAAPAAPSSGRGRSARATTAAKTARATAAARSVPESVAEEEEDPDASETLPVSSSAKSSAASRRSTGIPEIAETPASTPRSRRRRNIPAEIPSSATRQQPQPSTDGPQPAGSSSPAERRKRRSDAAPSTRSTQAQPKQASNRRKPAEVGEPSKEEVEQDEEEAEQFEETQAALSLGRVRPRNPRRESPELGSVVKPRQQPTAKRKGRPAVSPAVQRQPGPAKARQSKGKGKANAKAKPSPLRQRRRVSGDDDGVLEIKVQRFANYTNAKEEGEDDPLHAELPFANKNTETVVDVFSHVCEEVVARALRNIREIIDNADNAAEKKQNRIKLRAVEAYRDELRSRLLQQAIHLNHWQSLRKRLRSVQKEKVTLREEILRLRAEREQVALRMDAVRIKHEAEMEDTSQRLETSTLMHDIELAVAQGRTAPELSPKAEKEAELANLDLVIARIADEASSASSSGGLLSQVKDFNALLERAASALEKRRS